VSDNIIRLPSHSPLGEKRGNTAWIECGDCGNWFHSTPDLIAMNDIDLHCPKCHAEFRPEAARKIILP
jgi:NAD-dependent SIR2 family protein deacetylase